MDDFQKISLTDLVDSQFSAFRKKIMQISYNKHCS